MLTCVVCGEKFVWFCGGQVITYPVQLDCPTCGAANVDPGPPGWQPRPEYKEPQLDQDWDD